MSRTPPPPSGPPLKPWRAPVWLLVALAFAVAGAVVWWFELR